MSGLGRKWPTSANRCPRPPSGIRTIGSLFLQDVMVVDKGVRLRSKAKCHGMGPIKFLIIVMVQNCQFFRVPVVVNDVLAGNSLLHNAVNLSQLWFMDRWLCVEINRQVRYHIHRACFITSWARDSDSLVPSCTQFYIHFVEPFTSLFYIR